MALAGKEAKKGATAKSIKASASVHYRLMRNKIIKTSLVEGAKPAWGSAVAIAKKKAKKGATAKSLKAIASVQYRLMIQKAIAAAKSTPIKVATSSMKVAQAVPKKVKVAKKVMKA